jgi:hypothetical protein
MKTCIQLIRSFQVSTGKIFRPKHIVICDQTYISYLEKYFDKQPDNIQKFATRTRHTNCHGPWWCSWGSTRVFGKSNRDLEYAIFTVKFL